MTTVPAAFYGDMALAAAGSLLLLFVPGMLILLLMAGSGSGSESRAQRCALLLVGAFGISVLINALVGLLGSAAGLRLLHGLYVIVALDVALAIAWWAKRRSAPFAPRGQPRMTRHEGWVLAVVVAWFVLLLSNGGVVDVLTDAWWHMTVINKMHAGQTALLSVHPLVGPSASAEGFFYPLFWHVNLTLLATLTDVPLPVIWHVGAAFVGAVTFAAYYLFASALTGRETMALLSVVLYALLLGGLNAYHRVLGWPSNVSFVFLYFAAFLFFRLLDLSRAQAEPGGQGIVAALARTAWRDGRRYTLGLGLCAAVMAGLHPAAAFWFLCALAFYWVFACATPRTVAGGGGEILAADRRALTSIVAFLVALALGFALLRGGHENLLTGLSAKPLIHALPLLLVVFAVATGRFRELAARGRWRVAPWVGYSLVLAALAALLVDVDQLRTLFFPSDRQSVYYNLHVPRAATGWLGESLIRPGWDHQVRGGFLLTGLLAVPLAVWCWLREPGRGSGFLAGNAVLPLLVILSPYLVTGFASLIPATSVYRVHLLLFHPIILVYAIHLLLKSDKTGHAGADLATHRG